MICLFPSLQSQLKAWFWGHRGWGVNEAFSVSAWDNNQPRFKTQEKSTVLIISVQGCKRYTVHGFSSFALQFIFHNPFLSHCLIESKLQCHQRRHPNLSYRENLINHNVKDDVDNVSNHECSACYKTWDLFFPTCHTYLHNKAIIVFF